MAKAKDPNKLTPGEETAVREFIANGGDQTKACLKAFPHWKKWKPKTIWSSASTLFAQEKVQRRLAVVEKKALKKTEITKEYVLSTIVETIERCKQVSPVLDKKGDNVFVEGPNGDLVPAFTFDPASVLKGADLLAKHKGLYELDNAQKNPITDSVNDLPEESLKVIAERLQELIDGPIVAGKTKPTRGNRVTH